MLKLFKRFRGPAFTAAQWTAENPFLLKGEIGHLLENGKVVGFKIGPGFWEELDLQNADTIYPYNDVVTNPIGDAEGNLEGEKLSDIIFKMLNPYGVPQFANVVNNANGGFVSNPVLEIGSQVSGNVKIQFNISNQDNLVGLNPINATAGGIFNNEGNFPVGEIQLNLSSPLGAIANDITEYVITLLATHDNGTVEHESKITFHPKIMWAVSTTPSLGNGAAFMALNESNIISNDFEKDYPFGGNGYSWLAIPSILSPVFGNMQFTDVINPNLPAGYSMQDMGTMSINNGVATYNYNLYRSEFYLIDPTILRVS